MPSPLALPRTNRANQRKPRQRLVPDDGTAQGARGDLGLEPGAQGPARGGRLQDPGSGRGRGGGTRGVARRLGLRYQDFWSSAQSPRSPCPERDDTVWLLWGATLYRILLRPRRQTLAAAFEVLALAQSTFPPCIALYFSDAEQNMGTLACRTLLIFQGRRVFVSRIVQQANWEDIRS
ncbi:hypothetical protein HJG60_009733 [Phyllostomus discolor]|uniref:Uncharacterized protein n=1 Tax=Phyllostomus discolor TaxID=89673 RepID=A0A834BCG3_9CHIR|nr:hypothetical protein HJG60_009733 [Phyllostomus discolor]